MNLLLGRQAILDRNQQIIAYELLFRSADNKPITGDTEATAQVVSNTLSMFTIDNVLENKRGFINIGIDILRAGVLDFLPSNKFVIEILETQLPTEELVEFIQELKTKNYIFALDDFIISEEEIEYWEPVLSEVQIVKVDVMDSTVENLKNKINLLKKYNVALLAEKVETKEMFKICNDLGFSYFQGYFFTKPIIIEGQGFNPSIQGILEVTRLLQNDAEIEDIEQALKLHPDLIISLLKIINSASISPIQEITSIKQTIALLGKKALSQWLLLMLYSYKNKNSSTPISLKNDPLFQITSQRAKIMELLVQETKKNSSRTLRDEAFLTGILSLSEPLLHMPLETILENLNISQNIKSALLDNEGDISEILEFVKAYETNDSKTVDSFINKYGISIEKINSIFKTSIEFFQELANDL